MKQCVTGHVASTWPRTAAIMGFSRILRGLQSCNFLQRRWLRDEFIAEFRPLLHERSPAFSRHLDESTDVSVAA